MNSPALSQSLYLPLPDLIPLSIDSASPSSSSSSSLHDAYTTLAWNTLQLDPACAEWGPEGGREKGREGGWGSTAKGLFELLLAIKRQVTEYHVKNVQGFALEDSVRFELEMMVREERGREAGRKEGREGGRGSKGSWACRHLNCGHLLSLIVTPPYHQHLPLFFPSSPPPLLP